jgi:hypothetical protein
MTSRRYAVSASVFVAVGLLTLSACSSEQPSGLPVFTPSPSPSSPTSTSKWSPEKQQVINGYDRFIDLYEAISTKAEQINMTKFHKVAMEPLASVTMKNINRTLSSGLIQRGKVTNTISAVTVAGETATIKTCFDQSRTKLVEPGNPSRKVRIPAPSNATVSLVRSGDVWMLSAFNGGEGACVSG